MPNINDDAEKDSTDIFTAEKRSEIMARIGSKDTKPELLVRSLLHRLGYRFRLHRRSLPGTPDIVLPKYSAVIFVHGCFWHQHPGCKKATLPKQNATFWKNKLEGNRRRDQLVRQQLRDKGWDVLIIWECETRNIGEVRQKLERFLED